MNSARQRRAFLRKAQQLDRGAIGEKCDRRKIAPQNAKEIELAMRQIVDAIVVEIELRGAVPAIAHAVDRPFVAAAGRRRRSRPGCRLRAKTFSVKRLSSEFEPKFKPM